MGKCQCGHDAEQQFVGAFDLWQIANLTRTAVNGGAPDTPPRKEQRNRRHADEDGTIGGSAVIPENLAKMKLTS